MKKAQFISNVSVSGVPGCGVCDTELAVYYDPEANAIFGVDASFIDQVAGVVLNPLQSQTPQYVLLSEEGSDGGDPSVDAESLTEFKGDMPHFPLVQMLTVCSAVHELNSQTDADGGWTGTGLQRKCEELGVTEEQFRTAMALASVFLAELKEAT